MIHVVEVKQSSVSDQKISPQAVPLRRHVPISEKCTPEAFAINDNIETLTIIIKRSQYYSHSHRKVRVIYLSEAKCIFYLINFGM